MIFCMRYGNHIHQPSQCSFIFHTISSTLSLFYRTSVGCVCVYVFLETFNGTLLSFVLINSIAHDEKSSPFCLFYSKHRIVPFIVILDFYSFIFKYHWNIQATVESKNETKTRTTSIVTIISNCIPISMQQWRKKNEHKTFNSSHIPWINTLSSQCVGCCVHFFLLGVPCQSKSKISPIKKYQVHTFKKFVTCDSRAKLFFRFTWEFSYSHFKFHNSNSSQNVEVEQLNDFSILRQ